MSANNGIARSSCEGDHPWCTARVHLVHPGVDRARGHALSMGRKLEPHHQRFITNVTTKAPLCTRTHADARRSPLNNKTLPIPAV